MQRHDTQPCGTLCASQTSRLSPCSAAPFLSHRQAVSPLIHTCTHTHILTHTHNITHPHTLLTHSTNTHTLHTLTHTFSSHTHTPSHTHTLTHSSHTHTHTSHTLTNTHPHTLLTFTHTHAQSLQEHRQETRRPRGSAHTPGTWSVWKQPRVLAGVSRWTFHPLGATGTPRSSLRTRETAEGLRVSQLGPDQTSLLCKICRYDQRSLQRRGTSVHSQRGSFLVKNTETIDPELQTPFL